MPDQDTTVIFDRELPVPVTNVALYEQIYVLEQWLRRLAYAGLTGTFGSNWVGSLPDGLAPRLKGQLKQRADRAHLHTDSSKNMIWLLTLGDLRDVFGAENLAPALRRMTGMPPTVLVRAVDDLREIRNIVGHNRPTTAATREIANGIDATLRAGIDRLRWNLLYRADEILREWDDPVDEVHALYCRLCAPKFQTLLTAGADFFTLTRLPGEPFYVNLAVKHYLEIVEPITGDLLATLVNRTGDEFTIVWPKKSPFAVHERILLWFFGAKATLRWTKTPYDRQSASAVCDPHIWFYENEEPRDE